MLFRSTITDNTPPTINCPPAASGTADTNECYSTTVVLGTPTVSDNCTATAQIVYTNNAPAQYPVGVTIVTWTATDVCGNTSTCNQTVTITDNNQPPVIVCPAPVTQTAGPNNCFLNNVVIPNPATADNCGVTQLTWAMTGATGLSSPATGIYYVGGQTFNVGVTTVTYTASDAYRNSVNCSFTVTILDVVPPTFTLGCPDPISVNSDAGLCNARVDVPGPAYSDPCLELVSITHNSPFSTNIGNANGTYPVGTTVVTWTITDTSGNTNTCNQNITVLDNNAPTITCPANVEDLITDGGCTKIIGVFTEPVLTSNCTVPVLTYALVFPNGSTASGNGSVSGLAFPIGTTNVTYIVTSSNGMNASCQFTVTIRNLNAPQFQVTCPTGANQTITADAAAGICTASVTVPSPVIDRKSVV